MADRFIAEGQQGGRSNPSLVNSGVWGEGRQWVRTTVPGANHWWRTPVPGQTTSEKKTVPGASLRGRTTLLGTSPWWMTTVPGANHWWRTPGLARGGQRITQSQGLVRDNRVHGVKSLVRNNKGWAIISGGQQCVRPTKMEDNSACGQPRMEENSARVKLPVELGGNHRWRTTMEDNNGGQQCPGQTTGGAWG